VCRFIAENPGADENAAITDLLTRVSLVHRWMHIEKLQRFDGKDGFAKSAGEG
jgi:isocitrate dehydrogenase